MVSIHAPTRGATLYMRKKYCQHVVSIHAPTRGATVHYGVITVSIYVSIHAPTRGATHSIHVLLLCMRSFNPRTHTGCDPIFFGFVPLPTTFQSTHPHGVRPDKVRLVGTYHGFQSTHPHGVRHDQDKNKKLKMSVSIHAPTRGATYLAGFVVGKGTFQSTHPHGVRL